MTQNNNFEGMARLSLSDNDDTSPNIISHTPPPPGFEGSRSNTPNTCKSTSFNNLAMALGTGLAECMDQGMDDGAAAEVAEAQNAPKRTFTPDGYARQSRHNVSRLMGSGGGGASSGGFDYLNPAGTSHHLIPPANSSYLDKLKSEQGQQYVDGRGHQLGGGNGPQQQMPQQAESRGQASDVLDVRNHGHLMGGSNVRNSSSLAQASSMASGTDQKPVRFTAAMMANAQSSGGVQAFQLMQNSTNATQGGHSNGPSPLLESTNSHQLNQDLLRQQLHQQSNMGGVNGNGGKNFGRANSNPIGVTVMEPPSNSNSPAPQRVAAVGLNSDGLLYPLTYQQGNMQSVGNNGAQANTTHKTLPNGGNLLGPPGTVVASSLASASGGRASAPPLQSQTSNNGPFVPGGMTTMVMNNAAIRAYTASSLQMRVAELHQELGGGSGNGANGGATKGVPVGAPGTVTLRAIPTTAIPVVITSPTPPPQGRSATPTLHQVVYRPASRSGDGRAPSCEPQGDPLLNKQISRGPTPASEVTNITPNPMLMAGGQVSNGPPQKTTASGGAGTATIDPEQQKREDEAVEELSPFLRESKSSSASAISRGLAILYASSLHVPEVRSTCEAFGALESFRPDFGESRGVIFATYYDLRSAQLASTELPNILNKMGSGRIKVKYCVPLNSSSATDESALMLSKLPGAVEEQDLSHVLSSFGEVRAIHYQANASEEDEDGNELTSYLVEFYDVQDARQALLELEQTHPWGDAAGVKVAARSPTKRKQGKDLLMLLSRWRQGNNASRGDANGRNSKEHQHGDSVGTTVSPTPSPSPPNPVVVQQQQNQQAQQQESSSSHTARTSHVHHNQHSHMQQLMDTNSTSIGSSAQSSYYQQYPNQPHQAPQAGLQQYQLVMGPDGQYQYVLMNHSPTHHPQIVGHPYGQINQMGQMVIDPNLQQHQIMYAPVDQQYIMHNQHHMNPAQQYHMMPPVTGYGMHVVQNSGQSQPPTQFVQMPSGDVNSSSLSSGSHPARASRSMSYGKSTDSLGSGSSATPEADNNNLSLNIENVRTGRDRRTSLMVRNIPNKYTQRMLLDEFAAMGHGPTKMDFFYLPIDFKNKCNRGYAFVNFVDYHDICNFYDEYNGTSWKRFNSDKICDITYARIQGKAAMLKRFENSALMEKDDEYRPKVFVSHGERKGEVEVMPGASLGGVGTVGQTFQ